jgi:hypothetical protein
VSTWEKEKPMKNLLVAALTVAGLAALADGRASGQTLTPQPYYPQGTFTPPFGRPTWGPGYRPQLSPYLNLLRGGDPAANYFLGTVPEQQRRANAQFFRQQLLDLEAKTGPTVAAEDVDILGPTLVSGHPTAFNTTAGYFNNLTPRTPGMRPATPLPPRRGGR